MTIELKDAIDTVLSWWYAGIIQCSSNHSEIGEAFKQLSIVRHQEQEDRDRSR